MSDDTSRLYTRQISSVYRNSANSARWRKERIFDGGSVDYTAEFSPRTLAGGLGGSFFFFGSRTHMDICTCTNGPLFRRSLSPFSRARRWAHMTTLSAQKRQNSRHTPKVRTYVQSQSIPAYLDLLFYASRASVKAYRAKARKLSPPLVAHAYGRRAVGPYAVHSNSVEPKYRSKSWRQIKSREKKKEVEKEEGDVVFDFRVIKRIIRSQISLYVSPSSRC